MYWCSVFSRVANANLYRFICSIDFFSAVVFAWRETHRPLGLEAACWMATALKSDDEQFCRVKHSLSPSARVAVCGSENLRRKRKSACFHIGGDKIESEGGWKLEIMEVYGLTHSV